MASAVPARPHAAAYHSRRPRWIPFVEYTSVSAFVVLLTPLISRIAEAFDTWADAFLAAIALPLAVFIADFFSGFVHWFCDTFFEEDTPVIGRLLIHAFREHHRDPAAMTRHGMVELIGNSCMALSPVLALALWIQFGIMTDMLLAGIAVTMTGANVFHRWAHTQEVPAGIDWLQRHGLILSPVHHARHHQHSHDEAYCVTTGWANRITDPTRLFHGLGRVLSNLGLPLGR